MTATAAAGNVIMPADGPFQVIGDPCGMAGCDQPSTLRNTAGCVHEHVSTGVDCDAHGQALLGGEWLCGPCLDLGHECPLMIALEAP